MGNVLNRRFKTGDSFGYELENATETMSSSETMIEESPVFKPSKPHHNHHRYHHLDDITQESDPSHARNPSQKSRFSISKLPLFSDHGIPFRWYFRGFCALLALDMFLLALLVEVGMKYQRLDAESRETNESEVEKTLLEDSPICMPCEEVYLTKVETLQNRFRVRQRQDERNTTLCCAESHNDLHTLIGTMYLRVHYPRDRARGLLTALNVSLTDDEDAFPDDDDNNYDDDDNYAYNISNNIHNSYNYTPHLLLQVDPGHPPTEVNGTHKVPLKIARRSPAADDNIRTSVTIKDGCVKIHHSGVFYIYSHLPFHFHLPSSTLTQYVYRVRNGGEMLLLENSVFPCHVNVRSCEHSFVGGLFVMAEGDEVVLRVSNHSSIDLGRKTEFGVHRI